MTLVIDSNKNMYDLIADDSEIISLEKASKRPLDKEDISKALDEYKRLYKAGISSPGELMTLARAYPDKKEYIDAARAKGLFDDGAEPMIVGGPASVELVDREGHLITTKALAKAFDNYMDNFRTRNTMVLHSDVQVGWALPAYISKSGNIYKSGVDPDGLFFITELRGDTRIAKRVMEQINNGKLKSYSIAGSATKTQNIQKGMESYMQVDDMELAEVTVCEKGVNQGANFDILKAEGGRPTKSCIDGSCLMKSEHTHTPTTLFVKQDGDVDFLASLDNLLKADNPFTKTGKDDTPIFGTDAYRKREQLHHRLLDEQGFPSELEPEQNRYIPVSETEVDDDGKIIRQKPPWTVNEAGEDLGTRWTNEALTSPKAGAIKDKPYNLQKFVGLTGQRKKALIIEGYDSATDAFLQKEKDDEEPKEIKKILPVIMAIARAAGQAAIKSGARGTAQAAKEGAKQGTKSGTKGRGRGRGRGDGGGEEEEASEAPAPPSDMSARVRSGIRSDIASLNKAHDNVQYLMTTDQRTSTIPTMWRRKNVASGEPSIIPVLLDLTRAATTKKSDDCGCS